MMMYCPTSLIKDFMGLRPKTITKALKQSLEKITQMPIERGTYRKTNNKEYMNLQRGSSEKNLDGELLDLGKLPEFLAPWRDGATPVSLTMILISVSHQGASKDATHVSR